MFTLPKKIQISDISLNTSVKFGTSGVRGLAAEMDDSVCMAYTLAFLKTLAKPASSTIAVGIDLRPSSPQIALACCKALTASGYTIDYCGTLPTPALALYAKSLSIPAIMITGSHIPYDRNGIKFYTADGEITKSQEVKINAATVKLPGNDFILIELPTINKAALEQYIDRYTKLFNPTYLSSKRIGVYEHSSVARDCISTILKRIGATVISLDRTDQFVPIDTEAVAEIDKIKAAQWSVQHQLDCIVTTDGDGDRPLISDENGSWLRGDIVGLLTAEFLNADTVVTPISSNTAIEKSQIFRNVIRTKIGSPYVISGMEECAEKNCIGIVGFEANGGFMLGDYFSINRHLLTSLPTRDAMLPILCVLALSESKNLPISKLTDHYPTRYTASSRLQNIPQAVAELITTRLVQKNAILDLEQDNNLGQIINVDHTDGVRFSFEYGDIIHIRNSGNAPELRCYAESHCPQRAENLVIRTLECIASIKEM